jgi:hypothetical protein
MRAAVLLALVLPSAPLAAAERVAVLPPDTGRVDAALAGEVTDALTLGLAEERGWQVLSKDELAAFLDKHRTIAACEDASCFAGLADALGPGLLVRSTLARSGRTYLLEAQLVDLRRARVLRQSTERANHDTLPDAARRTARTLRGLASERLPTPLSEPRYGLLRRFVLEAGTELPAYGGFRMRATGPAGLTLGLGAGVMPRAYADLVNGTLVRLGAYDQRTADLASTALDQAFVGTARLGWDFGAPRGFRAELGYMLVTLGGGVAASEAIEVATGRSWPTQLARDPEMVLGATLHNATVHVGYDHDLGGGWMLAAELGLMRCFSARSSARFREQAGTAIGREAQAFFAAEVESYFDDLFRSHLFSPLATLMIGREF